MFAQPIGLNVNCRLVEFLIFLGIFEIDTEK